MAISKNLVASTSLVLAFLALHFVPSYEIPMGSDGSPAPLISPSLSSVSPQIDCSARCAERCSKSSRPNLCNRACGSCCATCNCVPSGTYGNYDECPCYANMTTHGGRKKCP